MTLQESIQLVKQYIQKLQNSGIDLQAVYLFGSVVNKTNTDSSDIDVCVVSKTFGKDRSSERVKLMLLREGISDLFEPHPLSAVEYASKINPFSLEVKRNGIRIL